MVSRKYSTSTVRFIPLTYSPSDSQSSALRLVLSLFPEWEKTDGKIEFVRFTDGITNTLLKAINVRPGLTKQQIDDGAVLLRAYGKGTDLIIDRERETQNHELLMKHGLAPELLARFNNGMMYRYISGSVTSPEDLRRPAVYHAVARRLAQWHAIVPCLPATRAPVEEDVESSEAMEAVAPTQSRRDPALQRAIDNVAPGKLAPNVWTVMQKWIYALPSHTAAERERQAGLQRELLRTVAELSGRPGLGTDSLVFAHCDLLSGNVIVQPAAAGAAAAADAPTEVSFIDYEYAVPSPAAFDIANHLAEWGGFDCDFRVLPTRAQRRAFIRAYVASYFAHLGVPKSAAQLEAEARALFDEVDLFRGVPGLYWGVWAIIQSVISQIDFDYASYAEVRLGEYYAWRAETEGTREAKGEEMPLRERRWAQEE